MLAGLVIIILLVIIYVSVRDATNNALGISKTSNVYDPANDPDLFWCDLAEDYVDIHTWEDNQDILRAAAKKVAEEE